MTTVQIGKALVPESRLAEFTGQRKTMAQVEAQMRPPPTEGDKLLERIKALETQVASLRRLVVLGHSSASATKVQRLQVRDRETELIQRIEILFFRMYLGTKVSLSTLMSTTRTKAVSDARTVLFCSITMAEPGISKSTIAARYAKHDTAIHFALRRYDRLTPSQKRNIQEIVRAYIAASDDHSQRTDYP